VGVVEEHRRRRVDCTLDLGESEWVRGWGSDDANAESKGDDIRCFSLILLVWWWCFWLWCSPGMDATVYWLSKAQAGVAGHLYWLERERQHLAESIRNIFWKKCEKTNPPPTLVEEAKYVVDRVCRANRICVKISWRIVDRSERITHLLRASIPSFRIGWYARWSKSRISRRHLLSNATRRRQSLQ